MAACTRVNVERARIGEIDSGGKVVSMCDGLDMGVGGKRGFIVGLSLELLCGYWCLLLVWGNGERNRLQAKSVLDMLSVICLLDI